MTKAPFKAENGKVRLGEYGKPRKAWVQAVRSGIDPHIEAKEKRVYLLFIIACEGRNKKSENTRKQKADQNQMCRIGDCEMHKAAAMGLISRKNESIMRKAV